MVLPSSSMGDGQEERKRLKTLAMKNRLLSCAPARCVSPLKPSKQVLKHHGSDILRKSQRKNRFLFSFPALLAPVSGATIGDLDRLSTKNPVLYLHFPQGRMKLFGTIVYPKNRYLTLQFSRGGKNVTCDDYFDNMIVFSEAWWIGTKEDNPEEARLDFPQELAQLEQQTEFDFRGGAGEVSPKALTVPETMETDSPDIEMHDGLSVEGYDLELTPVRTSQRNSGKSFNFMESSPEDVSDPSDSDTSNEECEKLLLEHDSSTGGHEQVQAATAALDGKFCTGLLPSSAARKPKSKGRDGPLVQATVSNMFKKAEQKAAGSSSTKE
ncbi:PREDICTED: DNA-binding protein RHL1 [Tarenaya hassleriana]|uniref:DNA-binding protein RHL1 n=1 Tax=Tarenaya hassleriana TaxID=28532 RepID=UPI00053C2E20|nr:PREDICTED: DNA-binding protein RHL1 [Tarenaya hassleriana]